MHYRNGVVAALCRSSDGVRTPLIYYLAAIILVCEWRRGMSAYVGGSEDRESSGLSGEGYAYVIAYD